MKTIEEKARAYDEAIEKGKQIQNTPYTAHWDIMKEVAEHLLPELKESEDERIRGNIIATIHLYYGEPLEDEAKEMINWLERQGKNNMGISEATKQKLKDNLNKALEKETPESWNEFLDGQNPADTEKGVKGNEREIPNSAWSEEDDKILTSIWRSTDLEYLETQGISKENAYKWIFSIKDRIRPKQEWSEEDEDVINHLLAICAGAKRYRRQFAGCLQEDITKYQTWLKSLKERYAWKPSDRQIQSLEFIAEYHAFADQDRRKDVVALLSDLKKLKE